MQCGTRHVLHLAKPFPADGGGRYDEASVLWRSGAMQTVSHFSAAFSDTCKRDGHTVVPAILLVPHNDPTLLLTDHGLMRFATGLVKIARRGGRIDSTASAQP